ncbi:unnamed protein product [Allacma fusca]|uniref:Uncharacterized protein n=1 Tax=Allacma fusca TaxID=39272 RepID=A0A8J2JW21_9HEXA|nr:unnamed protein product [Allacma fusca]
MFSCGCNRYCNSGWLRPLVIRMLERRSDPTRSPKFWGYLRTHGDVESDMPLFATVALLSCFIHVQASRNIWAIPIIITKPIYVFGGGAVSLEVEFWNCLGVSDRFQERLI